MSSYMIYIIKDFWYWIESIFYLHFFTKKFYSCGDNIPLILYLIEIKTYGWTIIVAIVYKIFLFFIM